MDAWWLDPKFSTIHITIPNRKSCKMYENVSCLQKSGLLIQNYGLGIQRDNVWADSTTRIIRQIFGIFKKISLDVRNLSSQVIFDHRYLCSYYAQWLPDRKQHYTIAVHWVQKICKVAKFNIFVMPLKSVYNFHCAIVVWKKVRYC